MESIDGNASASTEAKMFYAKEEAKHGLAKEIESRHIPDLRVVSGNGEAMLYARDQSDIPQLLKDMLLHYRPDVVVQPSTPEAVLQALQFAGEHSLTVIPRGAASSPFGGAVPVDGGMVLDLSTMDRILEIDVKGQKVIVQAGARWADVDHALNEKGLRLITSPSSKFSTVGGWVAGGGIGVGSLGGGHLRESVLGLKTVNSKGIRSYYPGDQDFRAMFGSEGQLGAIVEVTLKAKPIDPRSRPHLLIFPKLDDAISTALALKYLDPLPEDLIYFSPGKMVYSNRILGQERLAKGHALLVTSGDERSEKAIQSLFQKKGIKEQEEYLARMLWHERYFPMKLRRLGPGMLGAEVLTPTVKLSQMLDLAGRLCDGFALDPLLEVHFMQGNESLMLCYYLTDQGNQAAYALDAVKSMIVTAALVDQGARPYSWGIWNNSFVDTMPKDELDMMVRAKQRNDPSNIMNAGKFFELKGRDMGIPAMLLTPDVAGNGLRAMAQFSKPLGPLLRAASLVAKKTMGPGKRDEAVRTADQCAMCGACVSVCPAYKVLHDERVTARGKLQTVKLLSSGTEISAEHAHRTFLCMRCKACEQVCQSKLDLIPTYDVLEKRLEGLYSKDVKEIERFVRFTESTPAYDELIQRGLVLGAPKNGMGGGDRV